MPQPIIPNDVQRGNRPLATDHNRILAALRSLGIDAAELRLGAQNAGADADWFWAVVLPKKPPLSYCEYAWEREDGQEEGALLRNPLSVPAPGDLEGMEAEDGFYWVQEVEVYSALPEFGSLAFSPRWNGARIGIAANLAEMTLTYGNLITKPRIHTDGTRWYTNATKAELGETTKYAPGQVVRVWKVISLPNPGRSGTTDFPFGIPQESWVFSLALPWVRTVGIIGHPEDTDFTQPSIINPTATTDGTVDPGAPYGHNHGMSEYAPAQVQPITIGYYGDTDPETVVGGQDVNAPIDAEVNSAVLGLWPPRELGNTDFVFTPPDGSPPRYSTETEFETEE